LGIHHFVESIWNRYPGIWNIFFYKTGLFNKFFHVSVCSVNSVAKCLNSYDLPKIMLRKV